MAKFCTRCGRPLAEGEVCNCQTGSAGAGSSTGAGSYAASDSFMNTDQFGNGNHFTNANNYGNTNNFESSGNYANTTGTYGSGNTGNTGGFTSPIDAKAAAGFIESMKNRMGLGDEELNKTDAFEKGKQIIPDCVRPNEGEISVKQYTIATLRNRILGIPYTKAIGRMQVTNKRVIFRAPGRCLAGRTTLQHEFAIDELAGIEARREYVVNMWDLLIGLIVTMFGGGLIMALINATCYDAMMRGKIAGGVVLALLFGIAGCVPFFLVRKKWLLKLLCEGVSLFPLFLIGTIARYRSKFLGGFLIFLGVIALAITIFTLIVYVIKPNLVLLVKTKSATEAIDIKRRKRTVGLFGWLFGGRGNSEEKDDHTGYAEILPADDAEKCIREINAMINDIQKLGDFGIEKWQEK